ncbi:MAG: sporulation transcription factor Spo0A, partial [Ruminococcus sp.]|nr:sporulation transcription factor Spo0A [Ruminococcus sp.]
ITNMTKLIYPEIARKYSTSEKAVERASRAAIHSGWSRRDKKLTKSIFGNTLQFETEIPSSTLFIAAVVEWIAT